VALPEIIEELFSARYESQTGIFGNKAEVQARYDSILQKALAQFGCNRAELLKVIGPRYRRWIAENKLPQPPKEE
jgi:hypothetical protein